MQLPLSWWLISGACHRQRCILRCNEPNLAQPCLRKPIRFVIISIVVLHHVGYSDQAHLLLRSGQLLVLLPNELSGLACSNTSKVSRAISLTEEESVCITRTLDLALVDQAGETALVDFTQLLAREFRLANLQRREA